MRAVYAGWLSMYAVYALTVAGSALGMRPLAGALFCDLTWLLSGLTAWTWTRSLAAAYGPEAVPQALTARRFGAPETLLLWFAAAVLVALAMLAVTAPVGAYDAIGYRLPAIAQWLDAGAVVWVPGDDMLRNGYPLALEVLEASIACVTGDMAAVDVLGVVFVALGAGLLYVESRALGLTRAGASLAAGLFALVPMHLLNAPSGYADAPFSSAIVGTLLLGARFARGDKGLALRVMLGVCAGFCVALKPPGIAFAGLILGCAWGVRGRRTSFAEASRALVVPVSVLLPGCFFLARNVIIAHNPLYPLEVSAFGRVLFPGEGSLDGILTPDANVPKVLRALPRLLRTPSVWLQLYGPARAFDDRLAGLGYAFPLVALPALVGVLLSGVRKRIALCGLGFVASITGALFLMQPFSFWPRFTTWLWGAGALAVGLAYQALSVRHARPIRALVWALVLGVAGEAVYAVEHVKFFGVFGRSLARGDQAQQLADASAVSADFVRDVLVGRKNVCRTGWTDGTDDANLDGIVAQLTPRPSMHVVMSQDWQSARKELLAFGCDELIAIGQSPLRAILPIDVASRGARAFGFVDVIRVVRASGSAR